MQCIRRTMGLVDIPPDRSVSVSRFFQVLILADSLNVGKKKTMPGFQTLPIAEGRSLKTRHCFFHSSKTLRIYSSVKAY